MCTNTIVANNITYFTIVLLNTNKTIIIRMNVYNIHYTIAIEILMIITIIMIVKYVCVVQ